VDTVLGPEMKSTGEVMGIDYGFGHAFYKACIAADNALPVEGNVFISVTQSQREEIVPVAKKLREMGLVLHGTSGTVEYLAGMGVEASLVRKVSEGSPHVIDMIRQGQISLIINTPEGKHSRQDHLQIMRAAIDYGIPYITTIQAAKAAALAIEAIKQEEITLEPLAHYHKVKESGGEGG
jgi:carbamoyl-phosphate synthase large subunit